MTQPQGHSTSGSHERYKSPRAAATGRTEFDPVPRMRAVADRAGDRDRRGTRRHRGGGPAARARGAAPGLGRRSARPSRRRSGRALGAARRAGRESAAASDESGSSVTDLEAPAGTPLRRDVLAAVHAGAADRLRGEDAARRAAAWPPGRQDDGAREPRIATAPTSTARAPRAALTVPRGAGRVRTTTAPVRQRLRGAQRLLRRGPRPLPRRHRLRRGRRQDRRRQPGLRRPAGEIRRAAGRRHRHPRDRPSSARPSAWPCAACAPSPRSSTSTTSSTASRSCRDDLATLRMAHQGRPEGAGDRAHARPPAGGDLARGLAHGGHPRPGARHRTSACRAT